MRGGTVGTRFDDFVLTELALIASQILYELPSNLWEIA